MERPELLIPAGNLEKLRTALLYGADAVYTGVDGLSLRAPSAEMSLADLEDGVRESHRQGARVYAAANAFIRDSDYHRARKILPDVIDTGIDALIISDPGLLELIGRIKPDLPIHLSTQANTTNAAAVRFWRNQGVHRIISARELTLKEVAAIAKSVPDMELEIFVHGAMCMSYSGRCFLSAYRNRRSANEGDCSQPCRWEYRLDEKTRPDDPLILQEDERFTYLLSSKDLCLIEYLPEICAAGIAGLKVEGRMKSSYYVAVVTRAYRLALDAVFAQKESYRFDPEWLAELKTVSHRGYTTGFAFTNEKINETSPAIKMIQTHEPAGIVIGCLSHPAQIEIELRNALTAGESLDLLLPDQTVPIKTDTLWSGDGRRIDKAHSGSRIRLDSAVQAPAFAVLRKPISR